MNMLERVRKHRTKNSRRQVRRIWPYRDSAIFTCFARVQRVCVDSLETSINFLKSWATCSFLLNTVFHQTLHWVRHVPRRRRTFASLFVSHEFQYFLHVLAFVRITASKNLVQKYPKRKYIRLQSITSFVTQKFRGHEEWLEGAR